MGRVSDFAQLTDDLYHYTSAEVGVDSVLSQMRFRMGLIEWTNDPRESRPHYPTISGADSDGPDLHALWQEADHLLRKSAKVACFTLDYELPREAFDSEVLRGWAHPALWAHYGGRHGGVCLQFSRRALSTRIAEAASDIGRLFEGAVEYVSDPLQDFISESLNLQQILEFGLDAVVERFIERNHRALFFRKHSDWSNEYEYRWVLVEPTPLPVNVNVTGCLTGVLLGDAFPASRVDAVHHLASKWGGLEVSQVHFQRGLPRRLPPPPAPASAYQLSRRRSGSHEERVVALVEAEAARAEAALRAERESRSVVFEVHRTIQEIVEQARVLPDTEVAPHPSVYALPPEQRRTAAGVSNESSVLDKGAMCVVEALPKQSLTLVLAIAVQVFPDGRISLHSVIDLEIWAPNGNLREELWRLPATIGDAEVCQGMARSILARTDSAFHTFNERRIASDDS
jgi:hypothetical protein